MARRTVFFCSLSFCALLMVAYSIFSFTTSHQRTLSDNMKFNSENLMNTLDPFLDLPRNFLGAKLQRLQTKKRLFHVALTASGSIYNGWQCRIMYYWYKKFRDMPSSEMGGFTRILHSGKPDSLMQEIPTVIVEELPNGMAKDYIVLNRPWAFVQWLKMARIEEDYIMMAEPDHIFVKPLPNLALEDTPAAFPFFYITPAKYEEIIQRFFPKHMGPVSAVDPIGNSPAIIKKSQLEKIAPTWMNISLQMKSDQDANKEFGWVLEMYAYGIASAVHGIKHTLRKDFMIQPPWDVEVGEKYIIHYTYGCDYTMKSREN
ncbi:hypothetical protein KP509_01G027300 [Ceratopteris richardii]|uniref:Hydroxyproline O-arabinosyltransferase-like domain-containing protein n=1 Tax=Ceratopteris richardii TaxID=49495 RepID=A0A8T2VIF9_CERRI|nr:hypothetical protein KP509_01G027300 [Ceratopteris richardii]